MHNIDVLQILKAVAGVPRSELNRAASANSTSMLLAKPLCY